MCVYNMGWKKPGNALSRCLSCDGSRGTEFNLLVRTVWARFNRARSTSLPRRGFPAPTRSEQEREFTWGALSLSLYLPCDRPPLNALNTDRTPIRQVRSPLSTTILVLSLSHSSFSLGARCASFFFFFFFGSLFSFFFIIIRGSFLFLFISLSRLSLFRTWGPCKYYVRHLGGGGVNQNLTISYYY